MRTYLVIFFVAVALHSAFSAQQIQLAAEKPAEFADEEGCYSTTLNMVLPYNSKYSPKDGQCTQYNCRSDNSIYIYSCDALQASEGYYIVRGNKNLNYPACCDNLAYDPIPI